jgi:hypothetical protein
MMPCERADSPVVLAPLSHGHVTSFSLVRSLHSLRETVTCKPSFQILFHVLLDALAVSTFQGGVESDFLGFQVDAGKPALHRNSGEKSGIVNMVMHNHVAHS